MTFAQINCTMSNKEIYSNYFAHIHFGKDIWNLCYNEISPNHLATMKFAQNNWYQILFSKSYGNNIIHENFDKIIYFVNKIVLNINLIKFPKTKGKINENQKKV